MTITQITVTAGQATIMLDDEYVVTMAYDVLMMLGWAVGYSPTVYTIDEIVTEPFDGI